MSSPGLSPAPVLSRGVGGRQRRWFTVAVLSVAVVLASFVSVPAYAATAPTVTNPGTQYSGVSVATSLSMAATAGSSPYTWSATGLPAGLSIAASTGVVSGTPTAASTYAVKVTATDAAKLAGSASFSWTTGTAPALTNPGTRAAVVGTAVSQTMTATGAKTPYTWSATGLPAGLSIAASTGVISGTPSTAGTSAVKVTATDANKIPGSVSFSWDVAATALAVTNPGTQQATIGQPSTLTLAATGGTGPYTWAATGLPAGLSLTTATGVVSGTTTTAGTSAVSVTVTDTVGRTATGSFSWVTAAAPSITNPGSLSGTIGTAVSQTMTATGGTSPYTWTATGLPAGLTISSSGVVTGTPSATGSASVTLTATDATKRANSLTFTWTIAAALTVTDPGTQQATTGQASSLTLTAAGGTSPYTWTATGLPAGLAISGSGVVTGTPTTAGTASVTATVKDTAGRSATVTFSWSVVAAPVVTNPGSLSGTVGTAVSKTMAVTGGSSPYTWSATGLPAGLAISAGGVVTGTPTTAGSTSVTVTVKDNAARTAATTFSWAVTGPVAVTNPGTLYNGSGSAVSTTLTATGGTAPYTWTATGLPAGLAISSSGVVTGTPSSAGSSTASVTATDTAGRTNTISFTWTITAALVITGATDHIGVQNQPDSLAPAATGGVSPYSWTAAGLPAGLSVTTATGAITGTPVTAGTTTVTITVTDATGQASSVPVSWQILTAPATAPVMAAGTLTTISADGLLTASNAPTNGVALIGNNAYLTKGTQLVRVDKTSGAATVIAGVADSSSCTNGASGDQVRFAVPGSGQVIVIGADGRFVYVFDACGLRRVDPATGATTTLGTPNTGYATIKFGTIAGQWLYLSDSSGVLYRYDLTGANSPTTLRNALGGTTAIAADASWVYGMDNGNLYRINPTTGDRTQIAGSLPAAGYGAAAMLSVGDYLYAAFPDAQADMRALTIVRISKTDGTNVLVSPNGSSNGAVSGVTGFAADGSKLYVADASANGSWLKTLTPVAATPFTAVPSAPMMDTGAVSTITADGALTSSDATGLGVAVIGGYAYLIKGTQLVRVDKTTGTTSVVSGAGHGSYCNGNAASSDQVHFVPADYNQIRVIGADGRFVYVWDNCGLHRVDPATGASTAMTNPDTGHATVKFGTVAGQWLYLSDSSGVLYRYDLTGVTGPTTIRNALGGTTAIAADASWVYGMDNGNLYRINPATGERTQIAGSLPAAAYGAAAMLSVGDYIYAAYPDASAGMQAHALMRINKTNGGYEVIAGNITGHADGTYDNAQFTTITGITAADSYLYVSDGTSSAGAWLRKIVKTKRPVDAGGPSLPGETTGGTNPSENGDCNACAGDPVQTDTGALLEPATDLTVFDHGGSLSMSRTYSSAAATSNSVLGYGWAWPHGMTVTQASGSGTAVVTQENGSTATFTQQSDGTYKGAPRLQATLVKNSNSTWTFVRKHSLTMTFDAAGRITSQVGRNGATLTFTYNSSGKLAAVAGPSGRALTFSYDAAGYLSKVAAPSGSAAAYSHDANGNLTAVTDPTGATTRYGYDGGHLLTSITTARGATTTNDYDVQGRVVKQTQPLSRVFTFDYADGDAAGSSVVTVTAPGGNRTIDTYVDGQLRSETTAAGTGDAAKTSRSYDPATSQLTTVTWPDGATDTYTYDSDGNMLTHTDADNRQTVWTYDSNGDPLSQTLPGQKASTATYDAAGNKLTSTTPGGHTTRFTYNTDATLSTMTSPGHQPADYYYASDGDLASTVDPTGNSVTYTYNADGRIVTVARGTQPATVKTYDDAGRLSSITDPLQETVRYGYYPDGTPSSVTDGENLTTYTIYDDGGRLAKSIDANAQTTTYTYNDAGQLSSVTDPNGNAISYTYDKRGNKLTATNAAGTTRYRYDQRDRLISTTTPGGRTISSEYDQAGQVLRTIDARLKATRYAYNDAGLLVDTTDPDSRVTHRSYTDDGQIDTVTLADGSSIAYTYNSDGTVNTVANPDGGVTSYTYNQVGQTISKTLPGGITTNYGYDRLGQLATTTANDATTITDSYDLAGRLNNISYSTNTPAVHYTFDKTGRRSSMTDGTGTTLYQYDNNGKLTSTTDGKGKAVTYRYDSAGRLTALTYPNNQSVTYQYDAADRMTSTTDWNQRTTRFTWTADNQLNTQTTPDGTVSVSDYNENDQTTSIKITDSNSSSIGAFSYGYDDAGQLITSGDVAGTHSYTYDATGQLKSAATNSGTGVAGQYTVSPGGLVKGMPDGTTQTYNTAQQLTTTTPAAGVPTTYTYDQRGNRTTATNKTSTASYSYDQDENLTAVAQGSTNVSYTYNGDGLRVSRTTADTTTSYVWAMTGTIPTLLDDGTHQYLYGPSITPYAQVNKNGTVEYLHTDAQGSVAEITNSIGKVTGQTAYDPYGKIIKQIGSNSSAVGYTGGWTDPITGLVYLRARDYDPVTVQFLTIDPVVDRTLQPYAYADNNPLQNTDPTGMCPGCGWGQSLLHWGVAHTPSFLRGFASQGCEIFLQAMGWVQTNQATLGHIALDLAEILGALESVEAGAGLVGGGLVIDLGGITIPAGLAVSAAGIGIIAGGATLGVYAARNLGQDIRNLQWNNEASSAAGRAANDLGAKREDRVAEITGGRVARSGTGGKGGQGERIVLDGVGSTDVDVYGPNGELIGVGGPGKSAKITRLGDKLKVLKGVADQRGVTAQYYFEEGTPEAALNLARKWLGNDNVFTFAR